MFPKVKFFLLSILGVFFAFYLHIFYVHKTQEYHNTLKNTTSSTWIFNKIYEKQMWGIGSGSGSSEKNSGPYRQFLQSFIDKRPDIKTIVDFGCGDWQIMSLINLPSSIHYIGLDIVPSIISNNNTKFATEKINFLLIQDEAALPEGDLLIVKDVLQHWPNKVVEAFYNKIKDKYKYILITNCYQDNRFQTNQDIPIGGFRPLDLTKAPFNKKELILLLEYQGGGNKRLYLLPPPIGKPSLK